MIAFRKSYAGAMFDVEESVRHWESVELRRWRESQPNAADAPTRYLKIGVYHFSGSEPASEGCAAHGHDTERAAGASCDRLEEFALAVEATHCCGASVATLLVGVDTDTDAIRVHVPDAAGRMDVARFVDNAGLYESTRPLAREAAKDAIRDAVAACAGVAPDDTASEGMRWFCGYLLKNNIGQIDAVRARHGAGYADRGHTERLMVVGDAIDDVQLRNLAFQAQMETVEEDAADSTSACASCAAARTARASRFRCWCILRYDARIPGACECARVRARRLRSAILERFAQLAGAAADVRRPRGDGAPLRRRPRWSSLA